MIDNIKILLGEAAANYTEEQVELFYQMSVAEIEAYCNRAIDAELELIAQRITAIKLMRMNTEGLLSQSFSGVSENYIDGYPADIQAVLNRKRKVKVL
jgi:hypothetical protein